MVLPTTYNSALLLLFLSLICLGLWPNAFKLTGTRWRFELFYIDFAVGALLLSVIAAFTFGTLGSSLGFSDRMLVAGRTAQAFMVAGGFIFNLGNMLLVASMSLLGMSAAFPLTIGLALIVSSFTNFRGGNAAFLSAGIVLMIVAFVFDGMACRLRDLAAPRRTKTAAKPAPAAKAPAKPRIRKTLRGWIAGLIGGILLGLFYPIAQRGMAGDFGLGAYAGVLLFCIGMLISTVVFSFYFMNIAISGEPIAVGAYFQGKATQHFTGFAGGAIWALGILAASLAISAAPQVDLDVMLGFILPLASVLLVMAVGIFKWKEFAAAAKGAAAPLSLTALLFACGLVAFALAIAR